MRCGQCSGGATRLSPLVQVAFNLDFLRRRWRPPDRSQIRSSNPLVEFFYSSTNARLVTHRWQFFQRLFDVTFDRKSRREHGDPFPLQLFFKPPIGRQRLLHFRARLPKSGQRIEVAVCLGLLNLPFDKRFPTLTLRLAFIQLRSARCSSRPCSYN